MAKAFVEVKDQIPAEDYKPGQELLYHECGEVDKVKVLEAKGDKEWERYKLKILEVVQESSIVIPGKVGGEFDCSHKRDECSGGDWYLEALPEASKKKYGKHLTAKDRKKLLVARAVPGMSLIEAAESFDPELASGRSSTSTISNHTRTKKPGYIGIEGKLYKLPKE